MIEPRDRDWGTDADWSSLPDIEPRIPALLELFATDYAQREVLVLDERRFSYGELERKSALLARQLLDAGITKGCRVGVLLPSDEFFLISWFAITRIGAVAVSLSTLLTAVEIRKIIRHADLHMLVSAQHYLRHDYAQRLEEALPDIAGQRIPYRLTDAPHLRAVWFWDDGAPVASWAAKVDLSRAPDGEPALLAAVESDVQSCEPAGIIYTSGSTAEPKGVIHSQGNFVRQAMKLAACAGYLSDERVYSPLPFFWVGGLVTTAMCVMSVGGTLLATSKSGPELLDFLARERATSVLLWPHMLRALAEIPGFAERDWSAMRNGFLYEALPADKRPADPTLMSIPLGMTETTGPYTVQQRFLTEDQRGSVGPLMRGIEGRLVDPETGKVIATWLDGDTSADSDGQIGVMHLRGDTLMLGMVKRERADVFTPDSWYVTGDLCSFRRGHLHFHGRADDLIKTAGANVSPREVEIGPHQHCRGCVGERFGGARSGAGKRRRRIDRSRARFGPRRRGDPHPSRQVAVEL